MRDEGGGLSRGRPERTHLPAIIFALRIIIASCVDGTSLTPSTRPRTKKTLGPRPLERRLRHGLGRRRLDDLRLARFQGVEARRVRLEQVLELDALVSTRGARRGPPGLPRGAEAQADGVDAPRSGSPGVAGKAARRPLVVGLGDRRERAADADLSSIDLSRG